jgi:hypothetical protein
MLARWTGSSFGEGHGLTARHGRNKHLPHIDTQQESKKDEDHRDGSGERGWALGSTRGSVIEGVQWPRGQDAEFH